MMNNQTDEAIKSWGIVELMGHKVVAGMVSKSEMLGKPMLRVDVPKTSAYGEFTQFYGENAIYCVTFVSEDVARLTAEQTKLNPVSVYVPELITREQHEKVIRSYSDQIERLRTPGLPQPKNSNSDEESYEVDDGEEEWDEDDTD